MSSLHPARYRTPKHAGPTALIRDGAALIQSVDDIIEALETPGRMISKSTSDTPPEPPLDAPDPAVDEPPQHNRGRLVSALGADPVEVDELVRRCQVTPAEAQILFLELELAGRIERHPGNKIALIST
tara:strand:+ start:205 stop:588 length:384 start_codon:yes stop_codon:yes gene_type:complete